MRRHLLSTLLAIALALPGAQSALAQDSLLVPRSNSREVAAKPVWFSKHDALKLGIGVLAIGALSLLDEPVARAAQQPSLQSSTLLHNSTVDVQYAGDPGAIIISSGLYVAGKLAHRPALADASKHAVISIIVSSTITQSAKWTFGRSRPNVADGNAYVFHPFRGFKTGLNALPSGHTTAAFAAAGAFSSELTRRHPKAARVVRPMLYGVAALVGGSRIYNNKHWLSDVATGALIGEVTARRIVKMQHDGRKSDD